MTSFVPASFNSWTAGYGLGIHHANGPSDDTILGHDGYYSNLTDMFHSSKHGFTLVTMTNTQTAWFGIFNPMYEAISDYFATTNTNELEAKYDLKIYPNPSQNAINITSSQVIDELVVRNTLGEVCYHSLPLKRNVVVNLDSEGLFFLTINSKLESITRRLIIKK